METRLRDGLAAAAYSRRVRGDHDLNPDFAGAHAVLREAAVLVLVIDAPPEPRISAHMRGRSVFPAAGWSPTTHRPKPARCGRRRRRSVSPSRPSP